MKPEDVVMICVPKHDYTPGLTVLDARAIKDVIVLTHAFLQKECPEFHKILPAIEMAEQQNKLPLIVPYVKDPNLLEPGSKLPHLVNPPKVWDFDDITPMPSKSQRMKPEKPQLNKSDRNWKKFHR